MFQESYFTFDGISSDEFGVILARTDNDMFSRTFAKRRDVIVEKVQHNPLPFDFGFNEETLEGNILIAGRETKLDAHKLSKIAAWLYKEDYKPLISNENPDIVFYVKFINEQELYLGAQDQGYITLSFVANAPWGWSRQYEHTVDLRKTGETEIVVNNIGNASDYNGLTIDIELPSDITLPDGEVVEFELSPSYTICNTRTTKPKDAFTITDYYISNKKIEKYSLVKGETLHIDMENKTVESDNSLAPHRLVNCNKKWIKLMYGENRLRLTGYGIFTIRCQYPIVI